MHNNNDIMEEWWLLKTSRFIPVALSLFKVSTSCLCLLSGGQRDLSKQMKHFMFKCNMFFFLREKWNKKELERIQRNGWEGHGLRLRHLFRRTLQSQSDFD